MLVLGLGGFGGGGGCRSFYFCLVMSDPQLLRLGVVLALLMMRGDGFRAEETLRHSHLRSGTTQSC